MSYLEFAHVYADGDVQVRNHKQGTSRSRHAPDMRALGQSSSPLLRTIGVLDCLQFIGKGEDE